MRTIIWFIYFGFYFVVLIPKLLYMRHLERTKNTAKIQKSLNSTVVKWASSLLWLAGVTVQVSGKENIPRGPVVFVSNHQGNFDIPALLVSLDEPHGFIAKIETLKIPLVRDWMRLLNCIFIDRKDMRSAIASMTEGVKMVEQGHSLIIFPEGTRSRGEQMGEFKFGAFTIANKAQVPVVPIRISGSYKAMEANNMKIKPAIIRIKILPPIDTKDKTRAQIKELGENIRELIQNAAIETV